jgi:hypothetical protein
MTNLVHTDVGCSEEYMGGVECCDKYMMDVVVAVTVLVDL